MNRALLARMDLAGARCLDIGCQEGVASVLMKMKRQGAVHVTSYDRLNLSPFLDEVRSAYDTDFEHVHSIELDAFQRDQKSSGQPPHDVVVFTGVLYHMMDPLSALVRVRSMVRDGGLVLVETSALAEDGYSLRFNAKGTHGSDSTYFHATVPTLDYFCGWCGWNR